MPELWYEEIYKYYGKLLAVIHLNDGELIMSDVAPLFSELSNIVSDVRHKERQRCIELMRDDPYWFNHIQPDHPAIFDTIAQAKQEV